jgi:toxin ParE1/3/4
MGRCPGLPTGSPHLPSRTSKAILAWTQERFGEKTRLRSETLLTQAISDVVADPQRKGSHSRAELAPRTWTYHLRFSRDRVKRSLGRVRHPRHFLLYRVLEHGIVEIGRVLHDGMDLDRHLPEDYRA